MYLIVILLMLGGIVIVSIVEFIQQMIVDARVRRIARNEKEVTEKLTEEWRKRYE